MLKSANRLLTSAVLMLGTLSAQGATTGSVDANLTHLLAEASRGGQFRSPTVGETARAQALFARLLAGGSAAALAAELAALELHITPLPGDEATLIVHEHAAARRGRGLFVLRPQHAGDVLQVPHSFKDRQTREIGLQLFAEGRFAAAAWNTVPRWEERHGQRIDADLAHQSDSYFNAFTRAVGRHWPTARVLQIHGFDPDKRKSRAAADASLIISNGTSRSTAPLRSAAACLARDLAVNVGVYPDTVRELGGTTNAQGSVLRSIGHDGFVHLEMSADFRRRLSAEHATRRAWLNCLQSTSGS